MIGLDGKKRAGGFFCQRMVGDDLDQSQKVKGLWMEGIVGENFFDELAGAIKLVLIQAQSGEREF